MIASTDVAALAICKIFQSQVARGAGLDVRGLYRFWEGTGLRREDLAGGIKSLMEAQCLRSEYQAGECQYFLVQAPVPGAGAGTVLGQMQATAAEAALAHASARPHAKACEPVRLRREDKIDAASVEDRRKGPRNRLLMSLPAADRAELERHLELVAIPAGPLWGQGDRLRHAYFPVDCVISLVHDMQDGASSELAIVGNEGLVDVSVLIGGDIAPRRAVGERAGYAYRIPVNCVRDALHRGGSTQRLLLRYVRALLFQVAQTAACNRYHSIEQQLCRFLLSLVDRTRSHKLTATHEMIANTLGVRREGITEAMGKLKRAQLINSERSVVTLLDRRGLELRSCECYSAIRREYDELRPAAEVESTQRGGRRIVEREPVRAHAEAAKDYSFA